ncbi:CHAT domain-containing protein [Kibdelosporangium aridum]|uniref:CHAT domain-containing protein n=1 Tax=Kibdelosporangium aridum TaxID=2030 RepID=A0A428ZL50_KIBAR|nr:CHAT domain-containing protein [Kibdelosporangium aridum]RSM88690.1 CHAT domain-containing protein [Kibdelosporangium aridum]
MYAAVDAVGNHPELDELGDLLALVAPRPSPEADAATPWVGTAISPLTQQALSIEDWATAVHSARNDLDALAGKGPEWLALVGILARALRGVADTTTDQDTVAAVAAEARELLDAAGDHLLAAVGEPERLWVLAACSLGLTAIALSDGPIPALVSQLLERATEVAAQGPDPLMLAECRHGLAHALLGRSDGEPLDNLYRALALFRETLVTYQEVRKQPGGRIRLPGLPEHFDYVNLAAVHSKIATMLHHQNEEPLVAALHVRAALWTYSVARDIAKKNDDPLSAARAQLRLARLKSSLASACLDHTRVHKGAFRRDFQLYLAVIEDVPASTWDFASRYALSALWDVDHALLTFLMANDDEGVAEALSTAFEVGGLALLRHGVTGVPIMMDDNQSNMARMRRVALVVLHSAFHRVLGHRIARDDTGLGLEILRWTRYLTALMLVEDFPRRGSELGDLTTASADFERLRWEADPILRAFVRPYAEWLSVARNDGVTAVNGLAATPAGSGLEIILPSHARSFTVHGLAPTEMRVQLRDSSWVKTNSTGAVGSQMLHVDWSETPPVLPVLTGLCGETAKFVVTRLPVRSWDVWVMHVAVADGERLELSFPHRLRGPARTLNRDDVAILEAPGVTLEVSQAFDDDTAVSVRPLDDGTALTVQGEIRIAVRATPLVVDADVALLARNDNAFSGGCGAATASAAVSPTLTIPAWLMRTYSPLLLFDDTVDARLLLRLRDSSHRHIVVVGAPATERDVWQLASVLVDPARDVVFLVAPDEVDRVVEGVNELLETVAQLRAAPLYTIAGSPDAPDEQSTAVQVIVVPRPLAPAAVQLALDVFAFRRFPTEDIPTGTDGVPYTFQILGDAPAWRRVITALPNLATWEDLLAVARVITNELPFEQIGTPHESFLELYQPMAKRPAIIVPDDPAVVLACTPYARHLGALLLPDDPAGWEVARQLECPRVLAVERPGGAEEAGVAEWLPHEPQLIATKFAAVARADHQARIQALADTSSVVDETLLRRMEPSAYLVVASRSVSERDAAMLAANYAAALGAPLLLVDDESLFSSGAHARSGDVLSGAIRGDLTRDVRPRSSTPSWLGDTILAELEEALEAIAPAYIGIVSQRMTVPVELTGRTPLATRYAVGRLTAPDSVSLSLLMSHAALREEVARDVRTAAVVVDAAGALSHRYLAEARAEARHVSTALAARPHVAVTDVNGHHDRDDFLSAAKDAAILHFCGHGQYAPESGLVFEQGLLRAQDIPAFGRGAPIVFANACETGVVQSGAELGRAWSGLAAAFIDAGALNYLGSLWPILDRGSRDLAERFYTLLLAGHSVGESLRQARLQAFQEDDSTWAAVVLFGCPRSRLTSADLDRW